MIYAYRQGDALPEGCAGFYAVETAYNYAGDFHGDETVLYSSRERVDVTRKKFLDGQLVDMTEAESAIMDATEAQAAADAEAARQAAKPDALKTAENALIGLLRRTGYIPTNAVAIPPGTRAAVETNLIATAIDDPTGEAANLITRFVGLYTIIQSYGADPENAVWHE